MKRPGLIILTFLMLSGLWDVSLAQQGEAPEKKAENLQTDVLIEAFFEKRTGDLPEMLEHHQIRVLVVPSRSSYFIDKVGQPRGIDYELLKGWEKILNKGRKKGTPPISVIFIPVTLEELGDALYEGRGDVAAITLVTPARANEFAYATPIFNNIQEVIVTAQNGPSISSLEDLAGKEVYVVSGSAQMESMAALNAKLGQQGLAPIRVVQAEPYVAHENLLEMIHSGMIPAGAVPDAIATLWAEVLKNIVIHENIPVTSGMKAAWAVRKENRYHVLSA